MRRLILVLALLSTLGLPWQLARAGEVALYTGNVNWMSKVAADEQAAICTAMLDGAGIAYTWFASDADQQSLADWVSSMTDNGEVDVLVIYGWFPPTIYGGGNTQPDGSIAELFIESTDGDAIINHGDWMFYVSTVNNGEAGLWNMMDLPVISMAEDNTAMFLTEVGSSIAPSLTSFPTDRPLHLDQLAGEWFVEASLAQNEAGTRADPVIVRDGNRGRLIPAFQSYEQVDPKGAVSAEIIAWLMDVEVNPTQLGLVHRSGDLTGQAIQIAVQLQEVNGIARPGVGATTVTLQTNSATGRFDTIWDGAFNGSVTQVVVPAGQPAADFFYRDTVAGTPTLTVSAAGLTGTTLDVPVRDRNPQGEVAIYTGNTGWIAKASADAQAGICAAKLNVLGITNTWYDSATDETDLAGWVSSATDNGQLDVLVLYGYFPPTIYAAPNLEPDGSIAELFIESTDGDTIINHADYMFYVSSTDGLSHNGPAGIQNMMDNLAIAMWDDATPMVVTAEGRAIAPSILDFRTWRPFHTDQLAGEWFVELSLAQLGTRADPIIVRDGDRGRLIPMFQAPEQNDPKGAVAAETIAWLYGLDLGGPAKLGLLGKSSVLTGHVLGLTVQIQDGTGSPSTLAGPATVDLSSTSAAGRFDLAEAGPFGSATLAVTIPAGASTAAFYYKDTNAGTPTVSASTAGLTTGTMSLHVFERSFAPAGEVAIYTGNVNWITKPLADAQASICNERVSSAGITSTWYAEPADALGLADWVSLMTGNGRLDVLVLYGYLPDSIYPAGNASPEGSILETFIESTDGDVVINHADWMFYVSSVNNAEAGLRNIMDLPSVTMAGFDNAAMIVTDEGREIAPTLENFLTDRPLHLDGLGGEWWVEAVLAQSADGTLAEPVIVRDGNRGRILPLYQTADQADPKGAVAAEVIAWLMQTSIEPTQLGVVGSAVAVTGTPIRLSIELEDDAGSATKGSSDVVVSLTSSSGAGAFDTVRFGIYDGSVTSITIPAGAARATVFYRDAIASLATITATAAAGGLTAGQHQVSVLQDGSVSAGEVVIYTGAVGWMDKALADAQAQTCVEVLTTAGIAATWYQSTLDDATIADWMSAATGNGRLDVLVLYGYVPSVIYPAGNAMPDDSIAELFIESTDGDAILNHADYMFYVSSAINDAFGLQNMMDNATITMWDDDTPMTVTEEGMEIAPSLGNFFSDRPFHVNELLGEWFVEAALAENAAGTRVDPAIVRDGNRGRLMTAFQTSLQDDPKGAVAAEIISWLMAKATGGGGPVFRRGDSNADGSLNITDGIYVLNYLFLGGPEPPCQEAANANDDASQNITDGIYILNYLFLGGPPPASPGPDTCGIDPAGSPSALGCVTYTKC